MVRGVATVAQSYQVGSVIDATGGTGYEMMDISFALGARVATSPAGARVSCENYGSDRVPITGLHVWCHGLVLHQGADVRRGLPSRTVAAPGPRYATQRLRIRNLVPLSGDRPSARRSGLVQAFREWSLR